MLAALFSFRSAGLSRIVPTVVTVLPSPDACASVVPSLHLQTLYCPHSICVY
jgi:hypothetical protein